MNDQLVQRIRQCPDLPSLPSIAMQVLDLAQKADADIAEIARVISKDPALSGKILRTVNSSFYGRGQHVSTISHALVILGLQSVKTLVLGFSLVTNLTKDKDKDKEKGFKHLTYWRRSIYAAAAARTIASKVKLVQEEEAFLAALLMDIGMLVLYRVLGEEYNKVHIRAKTHAELVVIEGELLGMSHAQVGGILAEHWKFPPLLSVAIAAHHAPEFVGDVALRKLAEVVQLSAACADVFVEEDASHPINAVRKLCAARHNMSQIECDALLAEIGDRTKEVASLFEINIGSPTEYGAIFKKAHDALVDITLRSQQNARALQHQNLQLKEAATTDGLTGLANRARLESFLAEHSSQAVKSNSPLALIMLDLDEFKSINDQFGHPAGDQVLRMMGKLLKTAARKIDLAARYGGEEMALCLPNTNRATAAAIADSIRKAVAAKPVSDGGATIPVTASFGVASIEPGSSLRTPAQLIKAADLALYHAKHSGRNCVKVFAFKQQQQQAKPAA